MTRVRRHTCGAGALLGVLLLAAFAGTALTLHYETRGLARGAALDRAAGRIFAAWFQAAHRASQEHAAAFETTLAGGHTIVLTPAGLRALGTAPPGLPDAPGRNATFSFGVISDGTTRGVPMAFGVLEPAPDGGAAHGVAIREGALAAGLAGLESVGSGALMAPHLPAIEAVAPSAGLLEAAGEAHLGLVPPDAPSRLAGPTLDYDVSAFQAAFAGAPAVGALAALRRFDHQAVYGGRLQRIAVPGFPDANRMETDLDMGGNAISGAGRLSAESLALSGDLEAAGDIAVSGDLTVGQAVRVAGTVEAAGAIRADTASFVGVVLSGSLRVNGALRAANISSAGAVTAGSVAATGTVTAGSANLERLTANTVSARTVTAGTLSAAFVRATGIRVNGRLDASTAGFSTLIVGQCTGCGP